MGDLHILSNTYKSAVVKFHNGSDILVEGFDKIGKAFHGDVVDVSETGNITVIESKINDKIITGILELYSKYKFKTNKRGVERYKFIPLSKKYPPFLVASKIKRKFSKNVLITIKYLDWVEKFPYGQLHDILGQVDDINALYDGILTKHDLVSKNVKISKKQLKQIDFDKLEGYIDITSENVVSVDPEGCLDVDDAFSYKITGNNEYQIGIHISDVVGTLENMGLSNLMNNLTTSVYCPHKILNMFPKILSNGYISLLQGKKRLAMSLWLDIKENKITSTKIEKSILINKKTYSYEKYTDKKFMDLIKNLEYENLNKRLLKDFDTHKMIEKLMIIYNCEAAKFILSNDKIPIYRIHQKINIQKNPDTMPEELNKFLNIIKNKAAIYSFNENSSYHFALDLHNYIHFTSPIRRFVDCYNHNLVHNILNPNRQEKMKIDLEKINNFNKKIKKADRDFSKLKLGELIKNTGMHNFKGYVFDIDVKNRVSIYIPKYKITLQTPIINKSLNNIFQVKVEDEVISIINNDSLTTSKINCNKLINIEIYLEFNTKNPYSNMKITF